MFELKESDLPELMWHYGLGARWVMRNDDGTFTGQNTKPSSKYNPISIAAAIAQIKAQKPSGCEWCNDQTVFFGCGVTMRSEARYAYCGSPEVIRDNERYRFCPMCGAPLNSPCEGGEKE